MKLAKTYEPSEYEAATYTLWETAKAFRPKPSTNKGRFSIVAPPPNANGNLHIGHALTTAVEDLMIRYHRLKGGSTEFIPGADHAGFETWVVFEKQLEKQGKSRFDFPRERLYSMVWDFVQAQRGNMEIQLRELGASLDWDNLTFTLDKKVIDRTYKTFKQLWDDGLVYRGKRLVNYCTTHQTAFADIEVEYKDRSTPLYYIKYGPFEVATVRPEPMFADTAIAVHPDDPRYKKWIGKTVEVELLWGKRKMPVVADARIDPTFGTGAMKVTPAHDLNDWDLAQTHKLNIIPAITTDGRLTEAAGEYAGLKIAEARQAIVAALEQKGLIARVDKTYKNRVAVCYKCGTDIEPLLMDQWFLKVQPLAQKAIKAISSGKVTFTPKNKGDVLVKYLQNLKDWNLSRQIPWGIPIPAFKNTAEPHDWIFDERVAQKTVTKNGCTYIRDEDTFDTWFSSGQWPFITTDYLDNGELAKFYPLDVMETGADIIYQWVARMIMLGLYATKQVPFKHVYLHGLVLDEHAQKMSKSRGNVINPQDITKQYGSDALRMGLLAGRSPGVNQAFSLGSVIAGRNFANKLWNMSRFVEDKLGNNYNDRTPAPVSSADHWILRQLSRAATQIGTYIETYRFAEAFDTMYHTIWDDLADWYIEASKAVPNLSVLAHSLETALKMAHPFAPFVTETIWQTLDWEKSLLMTSTWPTTPIFSAAKARTFGSIQAIVAAARLASAELGGGKQELVYTGDKLIANNQELIRRLAGLKDVRQIGEGRGLRLPLAAHELWLDVDAATVAAHHEKLQTTLRAARGHISQLEARLANKKYVANAPKHVVDETRKLLADQQSIEQRLARQMQIET